MIDLGNAIMSRHLPLRGSLDDSPASDPLVESHLGLGDAVSSRYRDHGVDPVRLGAAARAGLAAAAETFDPDDGVDFVTHALPYVRASVKQVFRAAGGRIGQLSPRAQAPVVRHPHRPGPFGPFG